MTKTPTHYDDDISELSALQLCRYCSCTNSNITHYFKWKKWNRNKKIFGQFNVI